LDIDKGHVLAAGMGIIQAPGVLDMFYGAGLGIDKGAWTFDPWTYTYKAYFQCFGSGSRSMWIRIEIAYLDPDP